MKAPMQKKVRLLTDGENLQTMRLMNSFSLN